MKTYPASSTAPASSSGACGEEDACSVADEDSPELCEHGYPEGRGCKTCEFWERADYEFERFWDR